MYSVYAMQDGRAFTNFKSAAQLDQEIQKAQGITSQQQYNQYLKVNGDALRDSFSKFSMNCKCKNCIVSQKK
jgi:hypothetical protein